MSKVKIGLKDLNESEYKYRFIVEFSYILPIRAEKFDPEYAIVGIDEMERIQTKNSI